MSLLSHNVKLNTLSKCDCSLPKMELPRIELVINEET
uniref:Uncharacterized protein n=1 Tax=Lepeophtheirus salmonis TaxID=72036 RepID=A0A0K2T7R4_LEPSM